MIEAIRSDLWSQFGASIDMLENALGICSDEFWNDNPGFFYNAYHVTILLDYYLTVPAPETFDANLPFSLQDPANIPKGVLGDIVPDKLYSRAELINYVQMCRNKCLKLINELSMEDLFSRWIEPGGDMNYSVFGMLLYNMRHVQHHVAQLNMMLRKGIDRSPGWVFRAGE